MLEYMQESWSVFLPRWVRFIESTGFAFYSSEPIGEPLRIEFKIHVNVDKSIFMIENINFKYHLVYLNIKSSQFFILYCYCFKF